MYRRIVRRKIEAARCIRRKEENTYTEKNTQDLFADSVKLLREAVEFEIQENGQLQARKQTR